MVGNQRDFFREWEVFLLDCGIRMFRNYLLN